LVLRCTEVALALLLPALPDPLRETPPLLLLVPEVVPLLVPLRLPAPDLVLPLNVEVHLLEVGLDVDDLAFALGNVSFEGALRQVRLLLRLLPACVGVLVQRGRHGGLRLLAGFRYETEAFLLPDGCQQFLPTQGGRQEHL